MMTAHSTQQTTQQTAHYTTDRWLGCYGRGWGGELVKDAFAHPAKVSFELSRRIYQHALEAGFVGRGGTVLDPFGGVGGFAYGALFSGLQWVGVELEQKFVDLGRENIAMWNERYSHRMWTWGRATLLQGDSRKLMDVVGQADLVVSSPPYADSLEKSNGIDASKIKGAYGPNTQALQNTRYGAAHGQLGALPLGNLDMVISSPPFGASDSTRASSALLETNKSLGRVHSQDGYGNTDGQLAALPSGSFDAVVGSPPFENSLAREHVTQSNRRDVANALGVANTEYVSPIDCKAANATYSAAPNNIGNASGETFWSAARLIVEQCYLALKPGGVAIWVTKRYVKGGRIVEFTDQWVRLCESVGFVMRCQHHAMLVQDAGAQGDLFGGVQVKRKERKSFFRRLAERKGSPRIDWEDVVCMVKPTDKKPATVEHCAIAQEA